MPHTATTQLANVVISIQQEYYILAIGVLAIFEKSLLYAGPVA